MIEYRVRSRIGLIERFDVVQLLDESQINREAFRRCQRQRITVHPSGWAHSLAMLAAEVLELVCRWRLP